MTCWQRRLRSLRSGASMLTLSTGILILESGTVSRSGVTDVQHDRRARDPQHPSHTSPASSNLPPNVHCTLPSPSLTPLSENPDLRICVELSDPAKSPGSPPRIRIPTRAEEASKPHHRRPIQCYRGLIHISTYRCARATLFFRGLLSSN